MTRPSKCFRTFLPQLVTSLCRTSKWQSFGKAYSTVCERQTYAKSPGPHVHRFLAVGQAARPARAVVIIGKPTTCNTDKERVLSFSSWLLASHRSRVAGPRLPSVWRSPTGLRSVVLMKANYGRIDKYYMLIRKYVNASFRLLIREEWSSLALAEYTDILTGKGGPLKSVPYLAPNPCSDSSSREDRKIPTSIAFHLADIYNEELNKVMCCDPAVG